MPALRRGRAAAGRPSRRGLREVRTPRALHALRQYRRATWGERPKTADSADHARGGSGKPSPASCAEDRPTGSRATPAWGTTFASAPSASACRTAPVRHAAGTARSRSARTDGSPAGHVAKRERSPVNRAAAACRPATGDAAAIARRGNERGGESTNSPQSLSPSGSRCASPRSASGSSRMSIRRRSPSTRPAMRRSSKRWARRGATFRTTRPSSRTSARKDFDANEGSCAGSPSRV